ncbi:hypothetical protein RvY_02547 [Ramazzottius varieornatus]|uniref:DDE Tnp4 domain-containing protein n=1 Tax=Ramazzottius varieornatus TaxID=947166 RepID=A0A1D1UNU7_RAMVA|nr:hypothetical protein RvY_02547 [Ramazzottius varieornatus]
MAYPSRWIDLADLLRLDVTQLSRIYNTLVDWLYSKHCHRLESLDQPWLAREDVEHYARAVYRRGGRYDNCWAFVDGTARPICRPGADQRDYYSGHYRLHVLKWQSIVAPDGLIVNLWGLAEGRRHDCFMLAQRNLIARLQAKNEEWGKLYCVFGDRGYVISDVVQRSFEGADLTEEEKKFNGDMASCRIVVECGIGKIGQYFAFGNYQQNSVSAFLTNCHTSVYGFVIATSISNTDSPDLERHLDKN